MNREIKFRAWYKNKYPSGKGEMIYNIQDEFEERITLGVDYFGVYLESDMFEVMQYTGIHDCNGKEIWEGDIDKYGYIVTYVGDERENLGMNCGWYTQRDNFESWSQIECGDINLEIVGNIYENPELLNNNINL